MIAEIVFFDLSPGLDVQDLMVKYKASAQKWADNPDLLHKWYFHDPVSNEGGGVYIWRDEEAALRWHGPEYLAMIERTYGHPPRIRRLPTLLHVDALSHAIRETS